MILAQISIVDPANALTRYFNCVTRTANNIGSFSMENAEVCYDKVFKGAADNDEYGRIIKWSYMYKYDTISPLLPLSTDFAYDHLQHHHDEDVPFIFVSLN